MNNILSLHGADPENLYRSFNLPIPDRVIDFSTNTNALTWPEIHVDVERLASHYPDNECRKLRELIASREDISPSRVTFTSGSNEAIFALSHVFTGRTAILQPTYTEYRRAFKNARDIFTLDDAGGYEAVILSNPNNPTGKFMPDLSRRVMNCPDTVFIVDEAYIDFLREEKPERLCIFPNVVVLRSLTKIFHLSGARIGYVIANEEISAALRSFLPSWNVNSFAQELALYFLNDSAFYEATREFYRVNTPLFMEDLRQSGFEVMSSDVHYFLVRVEDDGEVIRHLLRHGIAVRHTRNFPGLEGRYIRVATRCPEDNARLIAAMKEIARP